MKPKKLPKALADKWQSWPTLEELHERSREHKLHAVRALLAPVPCYRCEDNSVRYDPDLADAALTGRLPHADDEDEDPPRDDIAEELRGGKLVDVMVLCRELARMVGDARREKNDTIKAMETPLRVGVAMMERAMDLMAGRLKHYDEMWDGMILTSERLASNEADRDLSQKKADQQVALRKDVFGLVKEQFPQIVKNFQLAIEGKTALDLVRSIEGPVIDAMLAHDVFSDEQKSMIVRLRKTHGKKSPQQPQPDKGEDQSPAPAAS